MIAPRPDGAGCDAVRLPSILSDGPRPWSLLCLPCSPSPAPCLPTAASPPRRVPARAGLRGYGRASVGGRGGSGQPRDQLAGGSGSRIARRVRDRPLTAPAPSSSTWAEPSRPAENARQDALPHHRRHDRAVAGDHDPPAVPGAGRCLLHRGHPRRDRQGPALRRLRRRRVGRRPRLHSTGTRAPATTSSIDHCTFEAADDGAIDITRDGTRPHGVLVPLSTTTRRPQLIKYGVLAASQHPPQRSTHSAPPIGAAPSLRVGRSSRTSTTSTTSSTVWSGTAWPSATEGDGGSRASA